MKKYWLVFFITFSMIKAEGQSWSLIWSDEFTAGTIDANNWNFETGGGGWGNNELENYTSRLDNGITNNGQLYIIAKKEQYNGSSYTSARMTTKAKHFLTYGKVEARIKIPVQQGTWPAFWMLGENISQVGWPQCGEIDIMEHVNKDTVVNGTIHWDNNGNAQYGGHTSFDGSKYHVYGIEWDQSTIKWFLDGNQYFSANILNNINGTDEFHKPFFAILNLAIGGSWPGSPDVTSVFPDTMFVDYVRFYQLGTPPVITSYSSLTFCQGDSVSLTSSKALSYLWSTSATTQSIVVKSAGSYSVSTTDSLGTISYSAAKIVTVNPLPVTPTISANGTVYTSSSTNGNQWYKNGILISGANQQNLTITKNGNYTVKVTNGNACSSSSLVHSYASVNPTPVITFSGSLTFCQGDSVILTSSASDSYLWSTIATTQSIVVKSTGNYTVATTDSFGSGSVSNISIVTVHSLPATPLISVNGAMLSSNFATGNQWYLNGNSISSANQQNYSASQNGNYRVKVTNVNACSTISAPYSYSVNINSSVPIITSGGSLTLCQGDSVILTTSASASYLWSTTETTQSIVVKAAGSYTVVTTDSYSISAVSGLTVITVHSLPATPTILLNGAVLSSSSATGNQWYLNANSISNANQQNYSASQNGNYSVKVTDLNACSNISVPYTYSVNPNISIPTITSSGSLTFCQGDSVILTCSSSNQYLWSTMATTQSIVVKVGGTFTVVTTDSFSVTAVSDSTIVTVNALPVMPTVSGNGTTFTSSSLMGNQWYLDGNIIIGATLQNYSATQNGMYSVKVTDNNVCSSTSSDIYFYSPVNIESWTMDNSCLIIPNPNNGTFHIEAKNQLISKIKIVNFLGEIIYESMNQRVEIDLSEVPKGIYIAEIQSLSKIWIKKLIIQ